ncbi:hypothetical protein PybrP1_001973, partial [[Pythium] brassicae (nom. inval.)]
MTDILGNGSSPPAAVAPPPTPPPTSAAPPPVASSPPPSVRPTLPPPPTATTMTQTPTVVPTQSPSLPPSPVTGSVVPSTSPSPVTTREQPTNVTPVTQQPVATTAPPQLQSPTVSPPGTASPGSDKTVVAYNSTTLPPGVDANVLGGGELMNVETTATTRGGQTSISYTIVVKRGDQIETVQQPGFNTTDPALRTAPPPSSTAGLSAGEQSPQEQQQAHTVARDTTLNSGAVAGLALAALFIGLLVSGVFMRRRNKKQAMVADKGIAKSTDESYASLENAAQTAGYRETMHRTRNSSYDMAFAASVTGVGVGVVGRHRSSLWEDSAIVAARVPFDKVEVGQLLSRGGYGEVYRGTSDSGDNTSEPSAGSSGGRSLPETAILQLVSTGRLQVRFSQAYPPEMETLARQCISVDPRERPTAAEVLYQLHVVLR